MAQRVKIELVSDLSGTDIADGKGETVTFALDGTTHEIDLTDKEADKFRGLFQDYIAAGRKVGGKRSSGGGRKSSGSGRTDLAEAREWLKANGHDVSDRGRVKQELLDIYDAR